MLRPPPALSFVFCACLATASAAGQRGLSPARVPPAAQTAAGFDAAQSAGLFVGVRDFAPKADIAPVAFAVDDAVDLAYLFAVELGLLQPQGVSLAIAGEPQKPESAARLQELRAQGASVVGAGQADVLGQLTTVRLRAKANGLLVVSIASHGVSDAGGDSYVLARDSDVAQLGDTAIAVNEILATMSLAKASRRLVLLDACRERLRASRGLEADADRATRQQRLAAALADLQGQVVLSASVLGGFAYDDQELRNGVFSLAVLDGLRGVAPADPKTGFVTARTLADYVRAQVGEWVAERGRDTDADAGWTSATFEGAAADMPLAVHIDGAVPRLGNRRPTVDSVRIAVDGLVARLADLRCSDPDRNDAVQDIEVDWGDGTVAKSAIATAGTLTHTYGKFGTFAIGVTAVDTRLGRGGKDLTATIAQPAGLLLHLTFDDIDENSKSKQKLLDSHSNRTTAQVNGLRHKPSGGGLENFVNGWRGGLGAINLRQALVYADHVPFSESFTIAAAVNMDFTSNDRIAGQGNWFSLIAAGRRVRFGAMRFNETDDSVPHVEDPGGQPVRTWALFVGVVERSGNDSLLRLYRDGKEVAGSPVRAAGRVFSNPGKCRFYVGSSSSNDDHCTDTAAPGSESPGLPGAVDDVRVYGRALTPNEIGAVHLAVSGRTPPR